VKQEYVWKNKEIYTYTELCKHFLVVQIVGGWKHLWMCMSTHSKANIALKVVKIKIKNQIYERCKIMPYFVTTAMRN
jgi:hypothetical protein